MERNGLGSHFIGRAGEYAVAAQLLVRGINVHFPAVDTGVDLIVGDRIRIQVKTARLKENRTAYAFSLRGGPKPNGKKREERDWSKTCDIMVFWGIDTNRFWIIPSSFFAPPQNVQTLLLGSATHRPKFDYGKMRELYASGMTQGEIGEMFGVSKHGVWKTIHRKRDFPFGVSADCDRYEDAWSEIEAAIRLSSQVDEVSEMFVSEKETA